MRYKIIIGVDLYIPGKTWCVTENGRTIEYFDHLYQAVWFVLKNWNVPCVTCKHGPRIKGEIVDTCKKYAMADQCHEHGYGGWEKT
jgi:hypothetical protein